MTRPNLATLASTAVAVVVATLAVRRRRELRTLTWVAVRPRAD